MIERAKKGLRETTDFGYEKRDKKLIMNEKEVEIVGLIFISPKFDKIDK